MNWATTKALIRLKLSTSPTFLLPSREISFNYIENVNPQTKRSPAMKKLLVGTVIGVLMMAVHICWAGIPFLMNYQGMLTDTGGNPLNGDYNLTFKIYSQSSGGSALWSETHTSTQVQDGLFNVILGSLSLLPSSVFEDTVRYLGITVDSDAELSPRIRITSMAYAYRALVADSAAVAGSVVGSGGGWVDDGLVVRLEANTDKVGIGTSIPGEKLTVAGGDFGVYPSLAEPSIVTDGYNVKLGDPDGIGNQVYLEIDDPGNKIVFRNANVGIGTASPSEKLDVEGDIDVSYNEVKHYFGFPRPDYNSGWVPISQGETKTLTHGLSGSYYDYVVDLMFYDNTGGITGPHQEGFGGWFDGSNYRGTYWYDLDNTTIKVVRQSNDTAVDWVRVRIWVIR
jgi:hypothetical protein